MKHRIPYTKPSITSLERASVIRALSLDTDKDCYFYIKKFQSAFKEYVGSRFAHATSSCTGALTLGLKALGIGPGDEVVLADTNWIATVAPIVQLGAKPIFVDINKDTWCIDHEKVEEVINHRTKAVIATHLYGNVAHLPYLSDLCERTGVSLVEDSAEAIGSKYLHKHVGTFGKFGVFSFHGTKTVSCEEGGMLVTNDQSLHDKVEMLNNHGRSKQKHELFEPECIGYKFKISNIQAALGCAQLQRIQELLAKKLQIINFYREAFCANEDLKLNPIFPQWESGNWMPILQFSEKCGISSSMAQEVLNREKISSRIFFRPLSSLSMFTPKPENRWSYQIPNRSVNLPSFHDITMEQLKHISCTINSLFG